MERWVIVFCSSICHFSFFLNLSWFPKKCRCGAYVCIISVLIFFYCSCILGELYTKKPLFQGNSEMVQLDVISRVCGTPCPEIWPDVVHLPLYNTYRPRKVYPRYLRKTFSLLVLFLYLFFFSIQGFCWVLCYLKTLSISEKPLDLLDKMLELDPRKRITAKGALTHLWLRDLDPSKTEPLKLPDWQDCHELWSKKQRRNRASGTEQYNFTFLKTVLKLIAFMGSNF